MEELPPETTRYKSANPMNYTPEEMAVKKKWLAESETVYPTAYKNLGADYLEMSYDVCARTPEAELSAMMERVKKNSL